VDVAVRFAEALHARTSGPDDPDLIAVRLASAAAAVLPVDGVGLSVHGGRDLRTPLAASSEVATTAERLQFTAGGGPCLSAARSGLPVFATEEVLARRWPVFHELLITHTPVRSALALSLHGSLEGVGAMDLYFADPDGASAVDVVEARCVAELVTDHLSEAADWSGWTPTDAPAWVDTPDARRRGRRWMAVGMLMLTCGCRPQTRSPCCAATPTPRTGPPTTSPPTWSSAACSPISCARTPATTADRSTGIGPGLRSSSHGHGAPAAHDGVLYRDGLVGTRSQGLAPRHRAHAGGPGRAGRP
jgi:hypothetical protein